MNTVLIGVAQARVVEFDAKYPGNWMIHCHLPHHKEFIKKFASLMDLSRVGLVADFEDGIGQQLSIFRCGLGGCMEGASRGYKEANGAGICLGLLPGTSRSEANPWVDLAIPTGVNSAQGALVAMAVDAAIVLGGGGGTLSEVGLLLRDGKPVVALDRTGGAAELVGGHQLGRVRVLLAHGAEEAVRMVLEKIRDKHLEKAMDIEK